MKKHLLPLILVSLLVLSACNSFVAPTHNPLIPGLAQTIAAETLGVQEAAFQRQQSAQRATETPIPTYPYIVTDVNRQESAAGATATPVPMLTPYDSQLNATLAALNEPCINAAEFIRDITIPDGTKVKAGQSFVKTWEFKNVGTCTWTPDYALVFIWGDRMSGRSPQPLGRTVEPGQTIMISVDLTAPKDMPSCQGNWMFLDSLGNRFGTGYDGRGFFWVAVNISGGRNAFMTGCSGGG